MAESTSTPLAVWAAVAVGVAGVSLAAMSDDRHGSRALRRALHSDWIVLRFTEKTDPLLGDYEVQVFDMSGNRGPTFMATARDAAAQSGRTMSSFRAMMDHDGLVDHAVTVADLEKIAENMGRGGHYFLIQLREAGILPPLPDLPDLTSAERKALQRQETAARKARSAAKKALSASRRGSSARVKPVALSPEAFDAMNTVQADRAVLRARQAVTLFRKRDAGYAEARVIAFSMVNDLVMEMAIRHQQGRKISGSWLDGKLTLKKYQRVTFTDLFEAWAKLTAEKLDAAR